MIPLTAFYLFASAAALQVAALSHERDRRHAVQIAAALMLACGCYNTTWFDRAWWFWPPLDTATAWFVAVRCRWSFRPWKLAIVLFLAAQVMAHGRWQIGDKFGGSAYAYHLTLNLLFLAQLAAVASSGSDRVRRALCDFLAGGVRPGRRWRAGLLHHATHHPRRGRQGARR